MLRYVYAHLIEGRNDWQTSIELFVLILTWLPNEIMPCHWW